MDGNITGSLLVAAVILLIIFLVFREVFCWYWKINTVVSLLTEIRNSLSILSAATVDHQRSLGAVQSDNSGLSVEVPDQERQRIRHEAWKAKGN